MFPLMTLSRTIFSLLTQECYSTIPQVMSTLCEYPIIDIAGSRYEINLSGGVVPLQFNRLGMVDDYDMYTIATRLLSPQMMIEAWECLMLECKVLVLSSSKEVIPHCCEFLRRIVSPLEVVNTYVPLLPPTLLNAIEAPFPYLLGACTDDVIAASIDLTDTAVVYLDEQCVRRPVNESVPSNERAPRSMKSSLMKEINSVLMKGLNDWAARPSDDDKNEQLSSISPTFFTSCCSHPMSPNVQTSQAVKIFEIFCWQNLSLLGARHCDVRAFYRQCERPYYRSPTGEPAPSKDELFRKNIPKHRGQDGRVSSMGFSCRSGVYCGCMQLLNEKKDIDIFQFLPCWVELDKERLAVHEYADEMPLISILTNKLVAVSPSAAEPEGHVFDIQVGSQMSYRFAATDPDSRLEWLRVLEQVTSREPPLANIVGIRRNSGTPPLSIAESPNNESDKLSMKSLLTPTDIDNDDIFQTSDDDQMNAFRVHVGHTQMVSFYKSSTDFEEYESILTGPGHKLSSSSELTSGLVIQSKNKCENYVPDCECLPPAITPKVTRKRSGSNLREESDTELCSHIFLKDLSNVWKLFISDERIEETVHDELSLLSTTDAKSNVALYLRQSLNNVQASYTFIGKAQRDYTEQKEKVAIAANGAKEGLPVEYAEREKNFLTNLFFKNTTKEDGKKENLDAIRKRAVNDTIKAEMNLRNAASELVQRVASTHRQCEADLRKMYVKEKMECTANIIDCNTLVMNTTDKATWDSISLNVKAICHSNVSQISETKPWNDITSDWLEAVSGPAGNALYGDGDASLRALLDKIKTSIREEIKKRERTAKDALEGGDDSSDEDVAENVEALADSVFPSHIFVPLLQSMEGYSCRQSKNKYSSADLRHIIAKVGKASLMDQKRMMRCLVAIFLDWTDMDVIGENDTSIIITPKESIQIKESRDSHSSVCSTEHEGNIVSFQKVKEFLYWAVGINDIIGLQAVRLITELVHTCLTKRMAERIAEQSTVLALTTSVGEFEREVAYGIYSRKRVSMSNMQPAFIWAQNSESTDVVRDKACQNALNETVLCQNTASKPCELSIQLLNSLREILRAANANGNISMDRRSSVQPVSNVCMQLTEQLRDDICKSSAFRSFEIQSCQLQMVDVDGMDDNAKAVFFCNIFNVMTIHGVMYGLPGGTSFYEKYNFMRNTKYNISGMIVSLMDIEHCILRAQTASPYSIFGPVSLKPSSISEKDPKHKLKLKKPFPLISFVLFNATASSPPLTTLWDPSTVKQELRRSTTQYLQEYVEVDHKNKTILVPEYFKWYWKDFGGAKLKVLNTVIHLCSDTTVASEINALLQITHKPRISFVNYDWSFVLKL